MRGFVKNALAFVLAFVSAYAFSFAIDCLVGGLLRIYTNAAFSRGDHGL